MSQVAKAADVGMGTIYNYFPNKEILINEIYKDIKGQEEALFLEVNKNQPIKTQFENYLTVLIEFFMHHPSYFNFLQQLEASPILTEESRDKGKKPVEIVTVLVKSGQKDRIIKNIDTEEIVVFIGGAISSYLKRNLNATIKRRTSLVSHIRMLWDGLKE